MGITKEIYNGFIRVEDINRMKEPFYSDPKKTDYRLLRIFSITLFVLLLSTRCSMYSSILSFSKTAELPKEPMPINNYQPLVIQPYDILRISVTSLESETVGFFQSGSAEGFMVNAEGKVDFPLLGEVHVVGNTSTETKHLFLELLKKYFVQPPVVSVNILNFKINIIGEVGSPGVYHIPNERINLIEAITLAGDFTSFSRRDSIIVLRENSVERTFGALDFDHLDVVNSPFFYLKQNDIVYVLPSKKKLATIQNRENKILPFISITTSLIFLLTIVFNLR